MNPSPVKSSVFTLAAAGSLALVSCSSPLPPPPPPAAQAPAPPASAAPSLIDVGIIMQTGTGLVTIQSIDAAHRTLVLQRANGDLTTFKAGPEVRRFNQLKVGDQVMSTVTENCTLFLVKGNVPEGAAAAQGIVRTPEGQNVGGIVMNAINVNAKVLVINRDSRSVLLQWGPTRTRSVVLRPDVDLTQVSVGDTILVRGTQSISIMVAKP